ncbi:MAG: hypothetical protein ACLUOI_32985 [Eisenbergiella sp.]
MPEIRKKPEPSKPAERKKPELLIPASSPEVLKTAVIFGADAVYIGGEVYGLRAKAKNFSMEDMRQELNSPTPGVRHTNRKYPAPQRPARGGSIFP